MAKQSNLKFWLIYIVIIVVVVGVALTLLAVRKNNPPPKEAKSIERNFSDFYRRVRNQTGKPELNNNNQYVIKLSAPVETVDERLQNIETVRVGNSSTQGSAKNRVFAQDKSLRDTLKEYAQQEDILLLWDLDQDLLIKSNFQVSDTVAGTLRLVTSTIRQNFPDEIYALECPTKRTMVVTANKTNFIEKYCTKI